MLILKLQKMYGEDGIVDSFSIGIKKFSRIIFKPLNKIHFKSHVYFYIIFIFFLKGFDFLQIVFQFIYVHGAVLTWCRVGKICRQWCMLCEGNFRKSM